MEPINVVSLFDGMSCGMVALERAGIPVKNYLASEIDIHAIKVSNDNYPSIIRLGDVKGVTIKSGKIDLILAGSPCQGFSFAGKQLNFNDDRSKLFFEFVRIYEEAKALNPNVKFLLENVMMKQEYQDLISELLGVKPILINSNLFSAQNRKRLYWTNISKDLNIVDKNIYAKDILQTNVDEKYFLSGKRLENWNLNSEARIKKCFSSLDSKKLICMTARQYANWYGNHVTDNGRVRQLTVTECERAQTLPDGYCKKASASQAFKMLGNGWTVDVIAHILKGLK